MMIQTKLTGFYMMETLAFNELRLSQKLNTIQKSTKRYWTLLKFFLNNRKIPVIPPFFHNSKFVTDFKEKAKLFNSLFCKAILLNQK